MNANKRRSKGGETFDHLAKEVMQFKMDLALQAVRVRDLEAMLETLSPRSRSSRSGTPS